MRTQKLREYISELILRPDDTELVEKIFQECDKLDGGNAKVETKEVIDYLNKVAGTRFKNTPANDKFINGRLSEGYTIEDFKAVIDKKVKDWLKDAKMRVYLRPETLFNATKFQSYLSEASFEVVAVKKGNDDRKANLR